MLNIYKHESDNNCIIISASNLNLAKQFIRDRLDLCGLTNEKLNVHEVENATTQATLIHIQKDYYENII
jgi:hypothetical protein